VSDAQAGSDPIEQHTASDTETPTREGQYGVGPFTIREVAILAFWAVAFLASFFSIWGRAFSSVWMSGIEWILLIGAPTVAVFLIVLRRFSPEGIRRVGSLGIDQFASVVFSVSALLWLQYIWSTIATVAGRGPWLTTWVIWVEFFAMLALVFLTVFAPYVAPFDEDFRGRPEVPAHRNARPVRAVIPRPAPEPKPETGPVATSEPQTSSMTEAFAPRGDPYAAEPRDTDTGAPAEDTGWAPAPAYARSGYDPAAPDAEEAPAPAASEQPFWALVPVERDVVDEATGAPMFRIGPTAWALVVADRGSSFLVRHEDGRVGVLNDVSGVTRG